MIREFDKGGVRRLLDRYYPGGSAWPEVISEGEFDIALDNQAGCQDVEGIAIDTDRDGMADIFLYDRDFLHPVSVAALDLDRYLRPLASFEPPVGETRLCDQRSDEFVPVGFPFSGRMLPDSAGKITSVMFAWNSETEGAVRQLLKARPDLRCQILYPDGDWIERFSTPECAATSVFPYTRRECDIPPCGGGMWVQNELLMGLNELGELVASAQDDRGMNIYVEPVTRELGAVPYLTDEYEDTGNLLASSRHLFFPAQREFAPEDNFIRMFASGLELVPVYKESATHLDMILTPTEEERDGKPVVVIAAGVPVDRQNREQAALDRIAAVLEAAGFYVARIPYIYTAGGSIYDLNAIPTAYSYNNVLMERYWEGGRLVRKVYMPNFTGYEEYNRQAAGVYRDLGYEVIPIRDMNRLGELGGAIRCMVKVTRLSHLPDRSQPEWCVEP